MPVSLEERLRQHAHGVQRPAGGNVWSCLKNSRWAVRLELSGGGQERRQEPRGNRGARSWEASWNTAQGSPGYIQACFFTLLGPDKGQSIFPIRSRQNSNAALRLNWQNMKSWWEYFIRLSAGASQPFCTSYNQDAPCMHLSRAWGNQTPPTWVIERLSTFSGKVKRNVMSFRS